MRRQRGQTGLMHVPLLKGSGLASVAVSSVSALPRASDKTPAVPVFRQFRPCFSTCRSDLTACVAASKGGRKPTLQWPKNACLRVSWTVRASASRIRGEIQRQWTVVGAPRPEDVVPGKGKRKRNTADIRKSCAETIITDTSVPSAGGPFAVCRAGRKIRSES